MPINEYLKQVKQHYGAGISTEHSYRGDLQNLLLAMVKGIQVTNEPKRQKCGAPDYIIQKKQVPLGYIEAKDIGADLDKIEVSDQIKRYLQSLDNFVLSDYLEFRFYKFGHNVQNVKIASIEKGKLAIHPECFDSFTNYIKDFCDFQGQTIKSAEKLAKMMAQKARMMEEVLYKAVLEEDENNTLKDQLQAFRRILIHDLKEKTFADIYAQTIAYGLFAARLHDITLESFSRQEARELIPKSNPFLRNLFDYVSGAQLDDRVVWIVDDLADIFRAADLKAILSDFGKNNSQADPFIHFYETFLAAYDPKLRKSRGVYYTPEPVVNFIVRAVDDILKSEFSLPSGLADTSKIKIKVADENTGKTVEREVHKVQILDPATGTGTFLAEVIRQIHNKFLGQEGAWSDYVEEHLIPRLNGFEILMASYTMCHLKLEMLLRETGYKPKDESKQKRFRVFLTNSLEEVHPDTGTLFASWLSKESTEANYVKRDTPVMVVMGNPPYANFGQMNQGEWIRNLISDYKKDLIERKINLDDDYIKFIRYGQYLIDKNGEGVLAFITNNSFIDGVTHRQMRKSLLETFDLVYILDLHGNSLKNESACLGSKDENVFDIMQGVSINLFIKRKSKNAKELAKVQHFGLVGLREVKYKTLIENNISLINWDTVNCQAPYFFFLPKNYGQLDSYETGFAIIELFRLRNTGIQTKRDVICISFNEKEAKEKVSFIKSRAPEETRIKFNLPDDGRDWSIKDAKKDIETSELVIRDIFYRPFDFRKILYTGHTKGIVAYPRHETSKHLLRGSNISLINIRINDENEKYVVLVTDKLVEKGSLARGNYSFFPLYLYPDDKGLINSDSHYKRIPNFNLNIIEKISNNLGLSFIYEKDSTGGTFSAIDVFDYIYAILHSPNYREKYKEFLKIDFPRVPYPDNVEVFWKLVKLGDELRQIHLLESPVVNKLITAYPINGNNKVTKIKFESGKVWINETQYFDKVPQIAWEFFIGGYQPAQKWLKDRKGRELNFEDILHYQKIIVTLTVTDRIMNEIDKVVEF